MPHPSKRPQTTLEAGRGSVLAMLAERSQLDFELAFFGELLRKIPDYSDALRAQAGNLTTKGLLKEGLLIDQVLVKLRPQDPDAHYNLACRYALMRQPDLAIETLRQAVRLGYADFRYMIQDRDLESLRMDDRFRALLREYGER
jgi:tetratricopeptide (TPR) repeat protein